MACLLAAAAMVAFAVPPSPASRARDQRPARRNYTVGRNVDITAAQGDRRHYEAYIAASPTDASELVACDYVLRGKGDSDDLFYLSRDVGRTWKLVLAMPHFTDPSCAIGTDGALYAAGASNGARSALGVMRSVDGGVQWAAAYVPPLAYDIDRPYITVLRTSRGKPIVIVDAYRFSITPPPAPLFFVSRDGGLRFSRPVVKEALKYAKPWFYVGNGVVGRGGAFYGLFVELDQTKNNMSYRTDPASAPKSADAQLEVYRSADRGSHFSLAGAIRDVYYDRRVPQISMPSLAIDTSGGPHRGRLYLAWPDARFGRHSCILLAYSNDQGKTWSEPQVIDRPRRYASNPAPNDFMPMVSVNDNGVVGVSWYDRGSSKNNLSYGVRFAASIDGGRRWRPSVLVSGSPYIPGKDLHANGGDTAGLAADSRGAFHLAWIANPGGMPAMWTARVRVHLVRPRRVRRGRE